MFGLHSSLTEDAQAIGDVPLCRLLLINDANYPWFILVPRRSEIREIFEFTQRDQQQLIKESSRMSRILSRVFQADKLNIVALGNRARQLHMHHVVRYQTDLAWPSPAWELMPTQPYSAETLQKTCAGLIDHLWNFTSVLCDTKTPRTC